MRTLCASAVAHGQLELGLLVPEPPSPGKGGSSAEGVARACRACSGALVMRSDVPLGMSSTVPLIWATSAPS